MPAVEIELPTDSKIGPKAKDFFICAICVANVVWKAAACEECEGLFCGKCIEGWLKRSPNCPRCNECYKPAKVPRIGRLELEEMEF